MRLYIYTIFDSKAEAAEGLFLFRRQGEALRDFMASCNNPENRLGQNPADFTLMELGTFNIENMAIEPYAAPKSIMNGLEAQTAIQESN